MTTRPELNSRTALALPGTTGSMDPPPASRRGFSPRPALAALALRWHTRRYERDLAALDCDDCPAGRARRLDRMAVLAGQCSARCFTDPHCESWANTAELLRAVAASERGQLLTGLPAAAELAEDGARYAGYDDDPSAAGGDVTRWEMGWAELAATRDRARRAVILRWLCGGIVCQPGASVLDDIAAAEDTAARAAAHAAT